MHVKEHIEAFRKFISESYLPAPKKRYDFDESMAISDIIERHQNGDIMRGAKQIEFQGNLMKAHGLLRISELMNYLEYDRPLKQDLYNSIRNSGLKEPIQVVVGKNGEAKVAEGNHRIKVAAELGMNKLPVYFNFYDKVQR